VTDQAIGSFVSQQIDAALLEAKQIDKKLSAGLDPGPLAGIPFGIKDNICVSNVPSTAGMVSQTCCRKLNKPPSFARISHT